MQNTYQESLQQLESLGAFHQLGAKAYHPGLDNIRALDRALGSPAASLRCVHVGGTNGKGSTASLIASVLTAAGYRTGLYTSPHLVDMRERIRIDGHMVPRDFVVEFTDRLMSLDAGVKPSYFEALTLMAFEWFRRCRVDVAVIEVGLGGRLDSTNIISPMLSVITNISADHTAILGDTLPAIAAEKAGIIKGGVPVVVGNADPEVAAVFSAAAAAVVPPAPVIFAQQHPLYTHSTIEPTGNTYWGTPWGEVSCPLSGDCQRENAATVFNALVQLCMHLDISAEAVRRGFAEVETLSGLRGRWSQRSWHGMTCITDTGHNPGAWQYLGPRLEQLAHRKPLGLILGFLRDKDLATIVQYMPGHARYWFVAPQGERALAAEDTAAVFARAGIEGTVCASLDQALAQAGAALGAGGCVFVGGSTFVASQFEAKFNQNDEMTAND